MFYKKEDGGYRQLLPGIELKTLAYGEKTLLGEFRLKAQSILPKHSHIYEQTGYLVEGRMRFNVGEHTFVAEPGDSWCIPGNTDHSAEVLEDSLAIEVFSPVREDYLPEKQG
ncbi:MAG TPA: cupin domain-containing protein [Syntrophales bacterium]|nr:cupin domain-containing protein [Syntrophales bacterium]HPQ45236.1 cupin domain-containing protein [Syntrophales bacterium]